MLIKCYGLWVSRAERWTHQMDWKDQGRHYGKMELTLDMEGCVGFRIMVRKEKAQMMTWAVLLPLGGSPQLSKHPLSSSCWPHTATFIPRRRIMLDHRRSKSQRCGIRLGTWRVALLTKIKLDISPLLLCCGVLFCFSPNFSWGDSCQALCITLSGGKHTLNWTHLVIKRTICLSRLWRPSYAFISLYKKWDYKV